MITLSETRNWHTVQGRLIGASKFAVAVMVVIALYAGAVMLASEMDGRRKTGEFTRRSGMIARVGIIRVVK